MPDAFSEILSEPLFQKIVISFLIFIGFQIFIRIGRNFIIRRIENKDSRYLIRKLFTAVSYVVVILVIVSIFYDKLGELSVTIGIIGAGVAFALQEVIASVAGWVMLSTQSLYHVGDRIQLGGIKGDVIDVNVLRTTLMEIGDWVSGDLYNGRIVRVANSFVFKEAVFNYSADFPFVWDEVVVPIKYGGNLSEAREIIQRAIEDAVGDYIPQAEKAWTSTLRKYDVEAASVLPMVTMRATDNWMEFTGRYVVDIKKRRTTQDQIFTQVVEAIEKTNGQIGIASATFHLVEAPAFHIKVSGNAPPGDAQ